ncbi:MAG TPA: diguanylate cyclase [Geobacteraceae bacterium]|nr:diguanylate cyclase [Geobacteraceae bacterium]
MKQKRRITVYSPDDGFSATLEIRLQSRGYQVLTHHKLAPLLGFIYSDPPDLIMLDISSPTRDLRNLVQSLKCDSYFTAIPVLGLINAPDPDLFPWDDYQLDEFIALPIKYPELFVRIELSLRRIQRVFDNNPLTRLPGNTSVQTAVNEAIGKPMAVCYIDINNFKPYNDVYGFARGDEVLRMLGRIMSNAVKESGGGFAGHIGGDDFVFIVPMERAGSVCTTIIDNFGAIALDLFEGEDRKNGHYIALNRKGEEERFPLLSIAIAVVPTDIPKICHCGKVAEMAAELKALAKKSGKSCYVLDKRKK